MVYISSDGTVHNGPRPWDMKRIKDTFWSVISTLELFVTTLLPFPVPGASGRLTQGSSSGNGNSNSRSGPNGGSSYRPSGGFRTISDIRPPPPAFGCAGGSCGR